MAKVDISWTDNKGLQCDRVTEQELSSESAAFLFDVLLGLLRPLSTNLRKADATGKIPMDMEIEQTPPYCLRCQHPWYKHHTQFGCMEECGTTICDCEVRRP